MNQLELFSQHFVNFVWGTPLVVLLLGGGVFFLLFSKALPYRHFGHATAVLLGRFDTPEEEGERP